MVGSTNTLTVAGAAACTLKIHGPIGARLRGSADVLSGSSFKLVDWLSTVTLDYTASASLDTAAGLWSGSIPAGNTDLSVTVANSKGDIYVGGSQSFASEDAAHVVLKNLAAGTEYTLHLDLANGAVNKAAVMAEMQKNTLWTTVDDSTESGYEMKAVFTPTSSGDFRFAWDNSAAGRLGDHLLGVRLTIPVGGSVFMFR